MSKPTFVPVDLTALQDSGVLMAANERFFWPLGLALAWDHHKESGVASNLHVREWAFGDGHVEAIGLDPNDQLGDLRRVAFTEWVDARCLRIPNDVEREDAARLAVRT